MRTISMMCGITSSEGILLYFSKMVRVSGLIDSRVSVQYSFFIASCGGAILGRGFEVLVWGLCVGEGWERKHGFGKQQIQQLKEYNCVQDL